MENEAVAGHKCLRTSWLERLKLSFLRGGVMFGAANGVALCLLLLVVDMTSPIHPRFMSIMDVSVFRLAGKVWATGGLPYVDYWDHKGPLIFFTNMLGYLLAGNENGVFWVDTVLLLASMYFIWKLVVELFCRPSIPIRLLALWLPILWYIPCAANIDVTETVCLPFLAAGVWLGVRDARRLDAGSGSVSWVTALVLGLGLSAGLLTRLTNALMVCVFALVLAVALALRGLWVDLGRCVLGFLGGVLVLTVPFVVYFAAHGALYDMVYGTLIYNLDYTHSTTTFLSVNHLSREGIETLCVPVLMVICALATMIISHKIDVLNTMLLLSGVLLSLMFIGSSLLGHYAAVCTVLWPCIMSMLLHFKWRRISIGFFVLVFVYSGVWTISQYRHTVAPTFECATVKQYVSRSDSVALYNISTEAYLRYDIDPVYPLAAVQEWQASFSDEYRDWLLNMYKEGDAEYILVQSKTDGSDVVIQPVLDSRYELVEKGDDGILVYRLVDSPSSEGGDSR